MNVEERLKEMLRKKIYKEQKELKGHSVALKLYHGDIIDVECDCIVNAANNELYPGGGVCGAIFKAAGFNELSKECEKIGFCATGDAVITKGCRLKQKYIIHTVGPRYRNGISDSDLRASYKNTLELADINEIESIAIPTISAGIYGYPLKEAINIAVEEALLFKAINLKEIILVGYNEEAYSLYNEALKNKKQ